MAAKAEKPLTLPLLAPKVNYRTVPRRYEETKPAIVQDFTHQRILNIGQSIQLDTLHKCNEEKSVAVKEAEKSVWEQAEAIKKEAVEIALAKAQNEHEKVLRKIHKLHEKALKEEAMRVEGEMQKLALEQVQATKDAGERKLIEAVKAAEKRGHEELVLAVAKARKEEQEEAWRQKQSVIRQAEEKLASTIKAAAEDKDEALMRLEAKKETEKTIAVASTHVEEKHIRDKKLSEQKDFYEQNVRLLQTQILEKKKEITALENEIVKRIQAKEVVEKELLETREEFDLFIRRVKPFNDTESGFLLPPAKTVVST